MKGVGAGIPSAYVAGQTPGLLLHSYTIRLRFSTSAGGTLTGTVEYPTGSGAIQRGTINDGKLAFSTTHVPQFETEPATITFTGEVRGRNITLAATMPDGGVATGIAHRPEWP